MVKRRRVWFFLGPSCCNLRLDGDHNLCCTVSSKTEVLFLDFLYNLAFGVGETFSLKPVSFPGGLYINGFSFFFHIR
jgi:hypothetical protein